MYHDMQASFIKRVNIRRTAPKHGTAQGVALRQLCVGTRNARAIPAFVEEEIFLSHRLFLSWFSVRGHPIVKPRPRCMHGRPLRPP